MWSDEDTIEERGMIYFGPVAEAARGGQSSPTFDLVVGFAVLAITWISHFRKSEHGKSSIWISIGISAICAVFLFSGLSALIHGAAR